MKVTDLPKDVTLYELAKVLGITAPAAYKYKKNNKIPDLRVYQLKKIKPEWVKDDVVPLKIVKKLLEDQIKRNNNE
jgi:predicted transcriptional regulator